MGALQLQGRLTEGVQWTLGGLMSENEGRVWRVAAEFVLEPGGGHELEVGAGYGAGDGRAALVGTLAEPDRALGAAFLRDRWRLGRARHGHDGRALHVPRLPGGRAPRRRGVAGRHPGRPRQHGARVGLHAHAGARRRPADAVDGSRLARDHLGAARGRPAPRALAPRRDRSRPHGRPGSHFGALLFAEHTNDALLTVFEGGVPLVSNFGTLDARGFGITVGHRFGGVIDGSLTYTFGQGRRAGRPVFGRGAPITGFEKAEFHDLAARVETFIDWSDTRLAALCRLNALADTGATTASGSRPTSTSARFDIQLTQGLPFLAPLTRADWEVLVAVRNMFYEASQAGFLDELAVQDPPTRVVGGYLGQVLISSARDGRFRCWRRRLERASLFFPARGHPRIRRALRLAGFKVIES